MTFNEILDLIMEDKLSIHGEVVNVEFETYRDIVTYADGYREIISYE